MATDTLTATPLAEMTAADPGYGHLPCRCDWEA